MSTGDMKRLVALLGVAGALAVPAAAQAQTTTTHCPQTRPSGPGNNWGYWGLTAKGLSCKYASQLAAHEIHQPIDVPLPGFYIGKYDEWWNATTRQVTSPLREDPFGQATMTHAGQVVRFNLAD